MRHFVQSMIGIALVALLGSARLAVAMPAPPIELRAVVACSKDLQPLPPPDRECLSKDVIVGDLEIGGAGRANPRANTGGLQMVLTDDGQARFAAYERDHAGARFAFLIGGRVIATSVIGDPAYRPPTIIPGLQPMTVPSFITVPGLADSEVKALSERFKAETAPEWCQRHAASTDRYKKNFCAGYQSQADLTEPAPVINAESLRAATALRGEALKFDCAPPKRYGPGAEGFSPGRQRELMQMYCGMIGTGPDDLLAPPDARNVKLALRAAFRPSFGFPATEIHIAISSATEGWYLLAQRDKMDWQTRTGVLIPADIDKILVALKVSHFWQQPFEHQMGGLDGEPILVEAAFDGWRHTSTQNAYAGVDVDILAKQLSDIARAHNTDRPLSWFK